MAKILFSFDPGNWKEVVYNGRFDIWLESALVKSAKAIGEGKTISAFTSVVFPSNDIIDLLSLENSQLGLFSVLAENSAGKTKSVLLAARLNSEGNIDNANLKAFFGPPTSIQSNGIQVQGEMISFINRVDGLTWNPGSFGPLDIGTWLIESRKQDALQKSVDMMIRVVFKKEEIIHLLIQDGMVAFSLVIFECKFNPDDFDLPGDCCNTFGRFSTLMINKVAPISPGAKEFKFSEAMFLVSSDSWRPNYPRTIRKSTIIATILGRLRIFEEKISVLKAKLMRLLLR